MNAQDAFNAAFAANFESAVRYVDSKTTKYPTISGDDVYQSAMVKVWQAIDTLPLHSAQEMKLYIFTAVRRAMIDAIRRQDARPAGSMDSLVADNLSLRDTLAAPADTNPDAELIAELTEDLTEDQRIIVTMRGELAPFAEIALATGRSEDACKKLFSRAKIQMQRKYAALLVA